MFSLSALLLEDAFKQATSLTNGVINKMLQQFALFNNISQGSVVTHLRWVGIFSDGILTNFLRIHIVKQFRKLVNI